MRAKDMEKEPTVFGARGCLKHLRFQHPNGKWRQFTASQMVAIRAIHLYCGCELVVDEKECDQCMKLKH